MEYWVLAYRYFHFARQSHQVYNTKKYEHAKVLISALGGIDKSNNPNHEEGYMGDRPLIQTMRLASTANWD